MNHGIHLSLSILVSSGYMPRSGIAGSHALLFSSFLRTLSTIFHSGCINLQSHQQCKKVWRFLKKQGIKPPYDPAIPLLGIYPEETKIEKDTCIPLFTAALFTIARMWKQPRCPSTDEWIKMLWYIYTMEHYSAINRNAFESVLMG